MEVERGRGEGGDRKAQREQEEKRYIEWDKERRKKEKRKEGRRRGERDG